MATYYNPGRSPYPVTLASGAALSVPAKGRVEIAAAEEGSESVQRAVDKGHLKRTGSAAPVAAPVAPEVAAPLRFPGDPVESPEPAAAPESTAAPSVEPDSDHVVRHGEGEDRPSRVSSPRRSK